jgi:acetyl esterase/lipase
VGLARLLTARPARLAAVRLARRVATLVALAALAGCSALSVLNAFVPSDDYAFASAAYGTDPRQQLDIYRPLAASGPAPVVVFLYGGSWRDGSRAEYRFVGEALASRGVVAVVADYRLYPQVRYPQFLRDAAGAVGWTLREIGRYGGDPTRVYVMGHSAGAYNAAMVALDARWLSGVGASPAMLAGWIGLAGPYDFLPITGADIQPVFDFPDTPADSQPIAHVSAQSPPTLLLAAAHDPIVNPQRNTEQLAARLRDAGGRVSLRVFDGVNHLTLIGAMAAPLRSLAPVLDAVAEFVREPAKR